MSCCSVIVGSAVRCKARFVGPDNEAFDPSAAAFAIMLPDGTINNALTPVYAGTVGEYYVDYVTTQTGRHRFKFTSTAPYVVIGEDEFSVKESILV